MVAKTWDPSAAIEGASSAVAGRIWMDCLGTEGVACGILVAEWRVGGAERDELNWIGEAE